MPYGMLAAIMYTLVLGMLVSLAALATDYHVSPSGNDANPGTQTQPWQTVDRVNEAHLLPGESVLFEGGKTFAGTIMLDKKDSGLPAESVVISSFGTGRAVIDGGKGTGLKADRCDFLQVKEINFVGSGRKDGNSGCGVDIANSTGPVIDKVEASGFRLAGVSATGVHNARITNVYAHDNGSTGIGVGDAPWSTDVYIGYCVAENNPGDPLNLDNHSGNGIVVGAVRGCVIEYCEAMNNGWDMPREGNGPVGIWCWNADRVIIQFCISHDNKSPSWDGGGFDIDGGVTNSIVQYNLSYNNVGPGYLMCQYYPAPAWKNNIIRYNISQNDGNKGKNPAIAVSWYEGMSDAEIYNNTVFNAEGPAVGFNDTKAPRVRFRNNIFVSGTTLITGGAEKGEFQGNLYWLLGGKLFEVDGYKSLEAWSAATGQERIGGALVGKWADPRLVRSGLATLTKPAELASMKEYALEPDSPCIGAGLQIENNGSRDFLGNQLPDKTKPSVGACQR